jgi:hypothetical protein
MNSILLILPNASPGTEEESRRHTVAAHLESKATQIPGAVRHCEGCWQLPVAGGFEVLCDAVARAAASRVPYKVLFFPEETKWIESK